MARDRFTTLHSPTLSLSIPTHYAEYALSRRVVSTQPLRHKHTCAVRNPFALIHHAVLHPASRCGTAQIRLLTPWHTPAHGVPVSFVLLLVTLILFSHANT
ncbi:hypothetical protein COCSADRAFT_218503 [Bipolaris sorokiniana ND90Pr]|uniref:Uncharacterized protein n=1 Tax=Cochliobolus sativus (strain ND90Pr / ATCC 201652) TaxID=665912 RepID=M2T732_COCSN|nr:uncharacterized protein COCSADRAFT_218503 [Bipolaris sorokiniana ND90Pr]EMD70230.1 hypothetical protein COCSADRAFT_218503 [Bipolaris sorokiniana ND90Pr]